jgi:hypothetical protein
MVTKIKFFKYNFLVFYFYFFISLQLAFPNVSEWPTQYQNRPLSSGRRKGLFLDIQCPGIDSTIVFKN